MDIGVLIETMKNKPSPGCPLICTLRTVEGNNLDLLIPNVGSFSFSKTQLKDFAREYSLPISLLGLMNLVESKQIGCPSLFFQAALTALSLGHGYGGINLESSDTRAFIATVGLSYRICTVAKKNGVAD
ncbi:hypothetical protein [Nostoc sp. FACHB-190]|uniref:hypothetical protein n=1 Tax=Nostoc sp. FACHB-190 TaxID=2692838 RepID=UPI001686D308|nr:hypothetical protein [Nostoc sp. FACHB-190]MBD2303851.1 hypothetical protein [Nostoc sp. FACHB-190]